MQDHTIDFITTNFGFIGCGIVSIIAIFIIIKFLLSQKIYFSKHHLESVFDSIDEPLAIINSEYTIKRVNKAYADIVNKNFPSILKNKCYNILRDRNTPCEDCRLDVVIQSGNKQHISVSPHPSDTESKISITQYPFTNRGKEPPGIIEHIRDITKLEHLKIDLEKQNKDLSDTTLILKKAQLEINDELNLAKQVQLSILPEKTPDFSGLKIDLKYSPIEAVGGDVYDFITFSDSKLGLFIGDASGHGLSSAFIGTISKMSLYIHSKKNPAPVDLLNQINKDLIGNIRTNHYLTCFWGVFDSSENSITYVRAGHPMPIVIRATGEIIHLDSIGTFSGILENPIYEQKKIFLKKGDRCYLYTDGIYEVIGRTSNNNDMLGYKKFTDIIVSTKDLDFSAIIPAIQNKLKNFKYEDDYTIMVLEVTENKNQDLEETFPGFDTDDNISLKTFNKYQESTRYIDLILSKMKKNGFGNSDIQKIKLCINELISNAIDHGNENDYTKKVILAHTVTPKFVKLCVTDEGKGFNPSDIPNPTLKENLAKEGGRGIYIIKNYVDDFKLNTVGNSVFIKKYKR